MKLYFMEYIKDVVIPDTNKCLNSAMNLVSIFLWLVDVWLWLVMLYTLSGNYFLRITLLPRKAPTSVSTKSYMVGAFIRPHRLNLIQILTFLTSIIPFSNRGRCRRGIKKHGGTFWPIMGKFSWWVNTVVDWPLHFPWLDVCPPKSSLIWEGVSHNYVC